MKPTKEQIKQLTAACRGEARPGGPSSFVRMFKPRFAALVKSGKKLQTIRPLPKRIPMPGDLISLRQWRGKPYRSKQRILIETKVAEVGVCRIDAEGVALTAPSGSLMDIIGQKIIALEGDSLLRFAREDGFKDWPEMREWFNENHGLPFDGIILYWTK